MDLWTFDDRRTFAVGLWFRVIAASAFFALFAASHLSGVLLGVRCAVLVYVCLGSLVLINGVYWLVAIVSGAFSRRHFYFHWAIDVWLICAVLDGLGDISQAVAIPAFIQIIVTSAVFISRGASMWVAAMSGVATLVWSARAVQFNAGTLSLVPWSMEKATIVVASAALFYVLIAFLAGTLARSLQRINDLLGRSNEELARSNRELTIVEDELRFQTRALVHDIRSPVAAAVTAITLAERSSGEWGGGGAKADESELLAMAVENLRRVDLMIDRLREVEELRGAVLRREKLRIREVLEELEVEFAVPFSKSNAVLSCAGDETVVEGDEYYLGVLFRNVIGNAVRYVPEDGSGIVQVTWQSADGWVDIEVSDNGRGVREEERARVFEVFRKGWRDERAGAMGMGLALAHRVVDRHGGRIGFGESRLGGATMCIRLPIAARTHRDAPELEGVS